MRLFSLTAFILCASLLLSGCEEKKQSQVTLYSAQKEHLIRPILDAFEKKTGISVNLTTGGKAALITRLEQEGEHTPADILLTADIGNIYQAKVRGLLQPVRSKVLEENIPAHLRDSEQEWFAFTKRARFAFGAKEATKQPLLTYSDLADPKVGKVLIRSSDNVYNQSLMAFMLHHHGEDKATAWAKGLVANMARAPQGGDRDQLTALAAGEGNVAVANSYYYGRLIAKDSQQYDKNVDDKVALIFPNQETTGVHINIRGGGMTKHAKHAEEAMALLEYLSGKEAQSMFAQTNMEYPVHKDVQPSALVASWGSFKADDTPLESIGALQEKAVIIMDAAGWK